MTYREPEQALFSTWICGACDVGGVDQGEDPPCWNCGEAVTVTGKHLRPTDPSTTLKNRSVYR